VPSLALTCLVAACGGAAQMTLSGADNDPAALRQALASRTAAAPAPARPMAYALLADGRIAAHDLEARRAVWTVNARVLSRIVVAGSFLVAREDDGLCARAVDDGRKLWTQALPPGMTLTGLAADADRAFALVTDGKNEWTLLAYDAAGKLLWRSPSPGALGTPAAARGLVYLPFLNQWLAILDARTGVELARLRQEDEAVSWVRAGADGVTFGSRGVLRLDENAATGRRGPGRYVAARLPGFASLLMHLDAFHPAAATYSALDRTRLLWRVTPDMHFAEDTVVLVAQRYAFGLDPETGTARWGRIARNDVVAAEDTGAAVLVVGLGGEIVGLDKKTGAITDGGSFGARVLGVTFAAEGWRPAGEAAEPAEPVVNAMAAIATDRDTRFGAAKLFAVDQLAVLDGLEPARALIAILEDPRTSVDVARAAGDALVERRDPEAVPLYVEALATHADYVTGTSPRGVEVLARALGALGAPEGQTALVAHLQDPATSIGAVQEIARALVAMRARGSLPALGSLLLLHRCDARFSAVAEAVADAVAALGGAAGRELLAFVAADPRTAPPLAGHVRVLLEGGGAR
jgi:outer membrane protein assembly factor BamB